MRLRMERWNPTCGVMLILKQSDLDNTLKGALDCCPSTPDDSRGDPLESDSQILSNVEFAADGSIEEPTPSNSENADADPLQTEVYME